MIVERLEPPSVAERLVEPLEASIALLRRQRLLRKSPWKGFGLPFNGQVSRQEAVALLLKTFAPDALIETGTFLGFTTRWLASHSLPTYSVEVSRRYRYAARFALRDLDDLTMIWGDSAAAIGALSERTSIHRPFAYLDAHWEEDVPLNAEVSCLVATWDDVLAVIDDFFVPRDPGYGYDIYGGIPLSVEQLTLPADVMIGYPAVPATQETGSRRGTLYLAKGTSARAALETAEQAGLIAVQRER